MHTVAGPESAERLHDRQGDDEHEEEELDEAV